MSDRRRVTPDPKQDKSMSSSIAAREAFELLNAGTKQQYRGRGDTATAARDRAAKAAGISVSQAERVWKRWDQMTTVNGDVYRALRNTYAHLCTKIENAADRIEREAQEIEETNAALSSTRPTVASRNQAAQRAPQ